jgi:hypothetical protein
MLNSSRLHKNAAFQYLYSLKNINLILELPLNNNDSYSGLFEQVNSFSFKIFNFNPINLKI